jgi:hypothetical protein
MRSTFDLGSAVVAYRPAAGEERSVSAGKVSSVALLNAAPWRTFRWYFGQRHYSGTYWYATQHDHVIYESRGQSPTRDEWVAATAAGLPRLVYRKSGVELDQCRKRIAPIIRHGDVSTVIVGLG